MKILIITLAVLISGCGDFTRNYLIGDELPPGDIQSQRIAMKTIKVFDGLKNAPPPINRSMGDWD